VTGVQTCALPIFPPGDPPSVDVDRVRVDGFAVDGDDPVDVPQVTFASRGPLVADGVEEADGVPPVGDQRHPAEPRDPGAAGAGLQPVGDPGPFGGDHRVWELGFVAEFAVLEGAGVVDAEQEVADDLDAGGV